jgi:hypothetical protein
VRWLRTGVDDPRFRRDRRDLWRRRARARSTRKHIRSRLIAHRVQQPTPDCTIENNGARSVPDLPSAGLFARHDHAQVRYRVVARSPQDHVGDVAARLRSIELRSVGAARSVEGCIGDDQQRPPPQLRRKILLLFAEAIHNVAKHSDASRASYRCAWKSTGWWGRRSTTGAGWRCGRTALGSALRSNARTT